MAHRNNNPSKSIRQTHHDTQSVDTLSSNLSSLDDLQVNIGSPSHQTYDIMLDPRNYQPIQHPQDLISPKANRSISQTQKDGGFDDYLRQEVVNLLLQRSGLNKQTEGMPTKQKYQLYQRNNEFLTVMALQSQKSSNIQQQSSIWCEQLEMMRRKVHLWLPDRQTRQLLYHRYLGKDTTIPQKRTYRTNYIYRLEGRWLARNKEEKQFANTKQLDAWRLKNRYFYSRYPTADEMHFADDPYPSNYSALANADDFEQQNSQQNELARHLSVSINRVVCYKQFAKSAPPSAIANSVQKYELVTMPVRPNKEFVIFQKEDRVIWNQAEIQELYPHFVKQFRHKSDEDEEWYMISQSDTQAIEQNY